MNDDVPLVTAIMLLHFLGVNAFQRRGNRPIQLPPL